jgi:hypothetical protein
MHTFVTIIRHNPHLTPLLCICSAQFTDRRYLKIALRIFSILIVILRGNLKIAQGDLSGWCVGNPGLTSPSPVHVMYVNVMQT